MSGISTGVGLISGINTGQLIEQLIALERRPIQSLQTRVQRLDVQRTAFLELSAKLLAVQNAGSRFTRTDFFSSFKATNSNEAVASVTTSSSAVAGSYSLRVHSLVSNHALLSRGFSDADRTPVGAGTISIEIGKGRVNPDTNLDVLNGGRGVARGSITVQDRTGASAQVDLSRAITVQDVLEAINNADGVNVRASVTSLPATAGEPARDRIVMEDLNTFATGQTPGELIVSDRAGSTTATDLGIAGRSSTARLEGRDVMYLSNDTVLSTLNDGNGVGRLNRFSQQADFEIAAADGSHTFNVSLSDYMDPRYDLRMLNSGQGVRLGVIRMTARSGATAEVDLSEARTVQDVITALNANSLGISATVVNDRFLLTDSSVPEADDNDEETTAPDRMLKIEDVSGFAAADLGIAAETTNTSINGRSAYRVETMADVLRAINYAPGNEGRQVEAVLSENGDGISLLFNTQREYAVRSLNGSSAAHDLGIDEATFGTTSGNFHSRRLVAGLNTVLLHSLRGGSGVEAGRLGLTDRAGQTTGADGIDLSSAQTLQDVIDLINADGRTGVRAALNASGHGIELRDESEGADPLIVADLSGTLAADLGIAGSYDAPTQGGATVARGGNAQLQYIARGTQLSELNGGRGVTIGRFNIIDSTGFQVRVDLPSASRTIGEVVDAINAAAVTRDGVANIRAAINENGDGIVVHDQAGGGQAFRIEDLPGGRTARDLRLVGSTGPATDGEALKIDGSYELKLEIGATDTLADIAQKLNNLGADVSASVFSGGSSARPFSLSISSGVSGRRGELLIDTGGVDLGLTTLSRARDAVVTIGGAGGEDGRLVTSGSNTIRDAVPGVTFDLLAVSEEPVSVNVAQDVEGIVSALQGFVDAYNEVQSTINTQTRFNPETQERGSLLGDPTANLLRNRLSRLVGRAFGPSDATLSRLQSIGIRLGSASQLEFDASRFRETYEQSPEEVEALFGTAETGFGEALKTTIEELTRDFDGVLARKSDSLTDQKELLTDRIEALNIQIEGKRSRLQIQFAAMETSLARLQEQQSSLGALQFLGLS
jgi:flagellar hook-associated protein 2